MVLKIHSDALYWLEPSTRSRVGGHFYLGSKPILTTSDNGAVLNVSTVIKKVVSSAADAEYGGIYHNA